MLQAIINDYKFSYQEKGAGEDLLFVHGSASDYRTWNKQLDEFGKEYHAIAYSRRFHRPNEPISEGEEYSMIRHVDDLAGFIEFLGNKPVHLVGHSYGAFVGLLLAIRKPELVKTLTLAEPPVITLYVSNSPKPTELLKLLMIKPKMATSLIRFGAKGIGPATAAVKRNDMETALDIFGEATLGSAYYHNLTDSRKEQSRSNLIKDEFLGQGYPPLDEDRIRNVNIPVLLVSGKNSPELFHYLLDSLNSLIPESERKEVSGASHIMHEDNPYEYNTILRSFLEKNKN